MRGGSSINQVVNTRRGMYSPRARRYFPVAAQGFHRPRVFSACAEVVPKAAAVLRNVKSILRVRGGSSKDVLEFFVVVEYSPRARR